MCPCMLNSAIRRTVLPKQMEMEPSAATEGLQAAVTGSEMPGPSTPEMVRVQAVATPLASFALCPDASPTKPSDLLGA
jgi:hypothetical protein